LGGTPESMEEFTRLDLYAKIFKPPSVKFKDLQAAVSTQLSSNLLPFEVRTDFIRVTNETILTPLTLQITNRELQFSNKSGVMHAALDIYGQVTQPSGKFVTSFERSVVLDIPEDQFQRSADRKTVFQEQLPLRHGLYKINVVVKDDTTGRLGTVDLGVHVPEYDDDKLETSSLILADLIQPLPTSQVGTGPFVIGGTKVRPSVDQTFSRDQTLGIFMQVYNLGLDPQTHRASTNIEYTISKDGKTLLDQPEDTSKWTNAGAQITLEKNMALKQLSPGKYSVQIKVTDNVKKQSVSTPATTFEVR